MKIFLKIIFGFVFVIFLASSVVFVVKYYNYNLKLTDIAEISSDNGVYSVLIQEIGIPKGAFGDSDVRITVKADGKILHEFDSEIHNDGKILNNTNWGVEWSDDSVTVTLDGEEQEAEVFILNLK